MNKLLDYKLIGIGEFSHGIEESWEFRFNLLKYSMRYTNKKIYIFNEMSVWQAENIMNDTIYSKKLNKFIQFDKIKIEDTTEGELNKPAWGKLWQYTNHSTESIIFLKIIKYIRKNRDRITLIGIDNDNLDRDYDMYINIIKYYNPVNINFLWAHNHHIDNIKLHNHNLRYIENKDHKYYCGYYLKKKLKDEYCIILSQSYEGENRFNSYCMGKHCNKRIWQLEYFYKSFKYTKNKKYIYNNKKYQLLTDYNEPMINFSNSYFKDNIFGRESIDENNYTWNYILFWNKVNSLEPIYNYKSI